MEMVKQQEAQVFNCELGSVRVIIKDNEPLFCLSDLAKSLDFRDGNNLKNQIIAEYGDTPLYIFDMERVVGAKKDGTPATQKASYSFVTEPQLYFVIMRSNSEKAKAFRQWVCNEVIPSIRKNGGYIANQENMTPEQIVANALIVAQNIIADRDKTIAEQKEVIEYQGGKLENFTSVEKTRRSRQELSTKLNRTIRLLAEQKFNKDYGKAYTYIYGEFAKLHCIADKVNMDYLKKNIDYLAECLAIATTELD